MTLVLLLYLVPSPCFVSILWCITVIFTLTSPNSIPLIGIYLSIPNQNKANSSHHPDPHPKMNDVDVSKKIQQMVRFIRQEAEEKAKEEFNIEKLQLAEAENKKPDISTSARINKFKSDWEKILGCINSIDPSSEVGGQLLGSNWCEVNVKLVFEPEEELIRPYDNLQKFPHVLREMIAWPCNLVYPREMTVLLGIPVRPARLDEDVMNKLVKKLINIYGKNLCEPEIAGEGRLGTITDDSGCFYKPILSDEQGTNEILSDILTTPEDSATNVLLEDDQRNHIYSENAHGADISPSLGRPIKTSLPLSDGTVIFLPQPLAHGADISPSLGRPIKTSLPLSDGTVIFLRQPLDVSSAPFLRPLPVLDFISKFLKINTSHKLNDQQRKKITDAFNKVKVEITHRKGVRLIY
ncbi:hypothetical protein ACS0TY_028814 [Phlomoides rotata]